MTSNEEKQKYTQLVNEIYVVKIDSPIPNEILDRQLCIININSDQFP